MHIRRIHSIRPYLTEEAEKALIQSVVISMLDYCNCIFVGIPLNSIHRLQLPQNAAARVVCKPLLCNDDQSEPLCICLATMVLFYLTDV